MNSLTPSEPMLAIRNGHAVTTSRNVAESFGKHHRDVLRAIDFAECSAEFRQRNFARATYIDAQGKPRPEVEMTRDGFVFVAMGFTGPAAARWKEAYIRAFNAMEARLLAQVPAPKAPAPTVPAEQLSAAHAELLDTQRKLIATQERLLAVTDKVKPKPSKKQRPITEEEIAEMRRLRATGLGCTEIGRRVGRHGGTVSMLIRDVKVQADLFGGAA
jgi:Rha family phage regulatory protein